MSRTSEVIFHIDLGDDNLQNKDFSCTLTGPTTTGFSIGLVVSGSTNIRLFTIQYLAVDRSFPYHLNVFNDIPVHYGTTLSSINGWLPFERTFTNTINYTTLANSIGSTHNTFGSTLSTNKVAVYLSGIKNEATALTSANIKYTV